MKTLQKIIPVLFLMLIVISGCKKSETIVDPVVEIFPLKTGNIWHFKTTTADSVVTFHINEVKKDTLISAGNSWYLLKYDTTVETICRNTGEGWWFLYQEKPELSATPALYYRYPAALNTSYLTFDSTLVTVTGLDDKVTVPAGTFSCYRYHMIHYREFYECDEYFAPGTGLIKHVVYKPWISNLKNGYKLKNTEGLSVGEITELVSYTLK